MMGMATLDVAGLERAWMRVGDPAWGSNHTLAKLGWGTRGPASYNPSSGSYGY